MKERNFTNYGVDQQRRQIPEPHFDKFSSPQTFSCWKMRFKTEVCSCADFFTEAMLWTKEVEMATSVYEKIFTIHPRNFIFQILNCWTRELHHPSKIYQNSYFCFFAADVFTSPRALVPADGDGGKGAIPNSRFLGSLSTGNSVDPVKERDFTNCGVDQQRPSNLGTSF